MVLSPLAVASSVVVLSWLRLVVGSGCDPGFFPCQESLRTCVEQRQQCDGTPDCPDGSDETDCDYQLANQFYDDIFRKRPDEDLDKRTETCEIQGTLKLCLCNAEVIACQKMGLTFIPGNLPAAVEELLLNSNAITALNELALRNLTELRLLSLSGNQIQEIPANTFASSPRLRNLYFGYNALHWIVRDAFYNLNNLRYLNLRGNHISKIDDGALIHLPRLRELDLRENHLESLPDFTGLLQLRILLLSNNRLRALPPGGFRPLTSLVSLHLSENSIKELPEDSPWTGLQNLHFLYLTGNSLTVIRNHYFLAPNQSLTSALKLRLDGNGISMIETEAFAPLQRLEELDLRQNGLEKVTSEVFEPLTNLKRVEFPEFQLCRLALKVRICLPKGDGISSTQHLLDSTVLRACTWMMALLSCGGNLGVLITRALVREPNAIHSFLIQNLAAADFLMGVYLVLIAWSDARYRGSYIEHDWDWRHSPLCKFCGFLSTVSCEASVMILTLITIDRLLSVTHPMVVQEKRTMGRALLVTAFVWLLMITLSLIPLGFQPDFFSGNGVCLPLRIHQPFAPGWEYSLSLFVVVNAMSFMFIAWAYLRMFLLIRKSAGQLRSTRVKEDTRIAQRFACIVATDAASWFPVITVTIVALAGVSIPEDLYAWLAVFALPVNSALNPVLYTLTTKMFKQKQILNSIRGQQRQHSFLRPSTGYESGHSTFQSLMNRGVKNLRSNASRKSSCSSGSHKVAVPLHEKPSADVPLMKKPSEDSEKI